uniref:Fibrinogen C-terminal domain-containing protein n=1 Tax=Suricata suricatta TaxID=37032 RepID=A0A673VM66_SURSU
MKALLALPLLLLLSTPPCAPQASGIRGDALEKFCLQQPLDCDDIYAQGYQEDGVYLIYPSGPSVPVPVFCDMTTTGGKWTVFQKRFNGSVSFFRGWNDYKLGFGRADGEYWLGLQNLHLLTLKQKYELRVDLEDFENNTASAKYAEFSISPNAVSAEEDGYTLYVAGFEDGGAGTPCCRHNKGLWEGGRQGWQGPDGPQSPQPPIPRWLPPSLGLGPGRGCVHSLQAALQGAAVSLHCRSPATQQPTWGGCPVLPGCHVMPRTASLSPVTVIPLPASTGPSTPPQRPPFSSPPPRQATPCPTTAARNSPPSTGTRTSSCRTAPPSPRGPSGSAAAISPTSMASTWAARTSPTLTASTGPSGRASTTPSSAPR